MGAAKLNIKFGKRTKKLAKFDASFPHLIFAQLVALGFQPNEAAWVSFYGFNKNTVNETLEERAKAYLENEKTQLLIKHFQDELGERTLTGADDAIDALVANKIQTSGTLDADATAMEMLRISRTLPDGKEKADLLMKYADIKGFKRAGNETKSENNFVGFVIPAQCHTCPCYKFAMDKGTKEDQQAQFSSKI